MIPKAALQNLYVEKKQSMQDIARRFNCSIRSVAYWMNKYDLKRRSWSEATYVKRNPKGDPFTFHNPKNLEEHKLLSLALGLYWGEGKKSNKNSIRLGNSDAKMVLVFMSFLSRIFGIQKKDLKFGLQIFTDIDPDKALDFWRKILKVKKTQFQKPVVTISGSIGTYRQKSQYGVVTLYYNNKKARDLLMGMLADVAQW